MKLFLGWVLHLIQGLKFWQWTFFVGWGLLITSWLTEDPVRLYCNLGAMAIFLFWIFKWFLVEPLMESWHRYREQRERLFDTIKNSDH